MHNSIVKVLLPHYKLPPLYYSLIGELKHLTIGDFVIVPFRNTEMLGVLWEDKIEELSAVPLDKLKTINNAVPGYRLGKNFCDFIKQVARYNMCDVSSVLKMVIPIAKNWKELADPTVRHLHNQYKLSELSEAQLAATNSLKELIELGRYKVALLDGVTGSGKTEVYLHLIANVLEQQKAQVLVLLPEICLTNQLIDKFEQRFGYIPLLWHSGLTPKQRLTTWHAIICGAGRLVIGARSAVFLPFPNLKLIIVDEEHDASYKQEDGVIYQGRDMAVLRAHLENIPAILATATPSLETIYNVTRTKYLHNSINSRYSMQIMPPITAVDMKKHVKEAPYKWLSSDLRHALTKNWEHKQQSMLFLNRRGYAPLTLCSSCGHRYMCPRCSAWLVSYLHNYGYLLECRYCGYQARLQNKCVKCQAENSATACGPGVERIAEELAHLLPKANFVIASKDTMGSLKQAKNVLEQIQSGATEIIICTQMMAHGYHFPNLTLVGIVDADIGIYGGDLRAAERTYQLLHQVSGRAGREALVGRVIMQTYTPGSVIMKALINYDRQSFISEELSIREKEGMPPFTKMAAILLTSKDEQLLVKTCHEVNRIAPRNQEVTILGPVPSGLYKLCDKYRYRFLIKTKRNYPIQQFIEHWFGNIELSSRIQLKIDIDPYSFI
jgi:primosomal protein N' (replication factor Y)